MAKKKPAGASPAPPVAATPAPAVTKKYKASIYGPDELPSAFSSAIVALQAEVKLPILMLVQNNETPFGELGSVVWKAVFDHRDKIPKQPIGVLIDSPGGYARETYRLARFLSATVEGLLLLFQVTPKVPRRCLPLEPTS